MQNIISSQSSLSLVIKRISSKQRRHVKPLVEALVAVTRESNSIMTMASGSATKKKLTEGIIMETIIFWK